MQTFGKLYYHPQHQVLGELQYFGRFIYLTGEHGWPVWWTGFREGPEDSGWHLIGEV